MFARVRLAFVPVLIALALYPAVLPAQEQERSDASNRDWRFSLQGSYLYGPINGYLQIPSGGEPGTTSRHRPKFSEIGIDDANIADVVGRAAWHNEELYLGAQFIRLSGDDTLDDALTSHAVAFSAGTSVSSDVQLDWYRFGYRHRFAFGDDGSIRLYPSLGGALLDFDYRLDQSAGARSARRSFVKANVQFGLEVDWQPRNGPFTLELDLLGSPYVSSLPFIGYEDLIAKYRLIDTSHVSLEALAGVAFEQIYFKDNQDVPNRVHADLGPMLIVGINLRF